MFSGRSPQDKKRKREEEFGHLLRQEHSLNAGFLYGLRGQIVEIQARAVDVLTTAKPWPAVTVITGMERGDAQQALLRINAALTKYGLSKSPVAIQVHCTPAMMSKYGSWLDLPLAIILLQSAGYLPDLPPTAEGEYVLVGELGLHGEVRRVPGILAIAEATRPEQTLIVPMGNERECALIAAAPGRQHGRIAAVSMLDEVMEFFQGKRSLDNVLNQLIPFEPFGNKPIDFGRIKGQEQAKEAALLCAAGGHNLLFIGPPGEGKSLLAGAIAGILPKLTVEEQIELTRIYSAAGQLERDGQIVTQRPFRAVHHTISKQALVGGGTLKLQPGEVTLAHLGILFLDELPEFRRDTLEALRQPLESGQITISRTHAAFTFPCRFTLVAAMNPCPCGYAGTPRCTCSPTAVAKYQKRLSGPLLDRIDLMVELQPLTLEERFSETTDGMTELLRQKVEAARAHQISRFRGTSIRCNAAIPAGRILDYCHFSPEGLQHYKQRVAQAGISTRLTDRLARVARTIADLDDAKQIDPHHVDRAALFVLDQRFNFVTISEADAPT
jgi:magnesium chelatase family protein